jgi:phage gp46-like protein
MSADLALTFNPAILAEDISTARGDFAIDTGLLTAVIVSLFTDRLAEPGDILPDNNGPRGWWGDGYNGYLIGSRLWLLRRSTLTQATLNLAQDYATEALQWMIDDGVVGAVVVVATQTGINSASLAVTLTQAGASNTYKLAWRNQAATNVAAANLTIAA